MGTTKIIFIMNKATKADQRAALSRAGYTAISYSGKSRGWYVISPKGEEEFIPYGNKFFQLRVPGRKDNGFLRFFYRPTERHNQYGTFLGYNEGFLVS